MSEYNMSHTGAELDEAINKVKSGYILPTGSINITENEKTYDVTEFAKAIVNIASGITPIGNLSDSLITRASGGNEHIATIPAGYYVNEDITISEWKSGLITGSGVVGESFTIPYSSIGFTPRWILLMGNSGNIATTNTMLCYFLFLSTTGQNSARGYYTTTSSGASTTTALATFDLNGCKIPAATSSVKYASSSYRWYALR